MIEFPGLPKWPNLVVKGIGKPLTQEQTFEVMLRTSSFWLSSNDEDFEDELYAIIDKKLGYNFNSDDRSDSKSKRLKNLSKDLSVLNLNYLCNERLVSCWLGGPHGWLDWTGIIGCSNYNIGKWPEAEEVFDEWKLIAEAFPYLDLRCQLMSGETSADDSKPLIEYVIRAGEVSASIPTDEKLVSNIPYVDGCEHMLKDLRRVGGEQGCTVELFENALAVCLDQVKTKVIV